MKKIILFTNMNSIQKYWESSLVDSFDSIHINNYEELTAYLTVNTNSTMILLDELSIKNIVQSIDELSKFKHAKLLIFNARPEVHHAATLLSSKISAYENTYMAQNNLLKMIDSVQNGKQWLFTDLTNYIINKFIQGRSTDEPDFMKVLTIKEKEIALMIADGYTNKEIAQAEKIALSTVKGHIQKIFEKAQVTDRVALVLRFKK